MCQNKKKPFLWYHPFVILSSFSNVTTNTTNDAHSKSDDPKFMDLVTPNSNHTRPTESWWYTYRRQLTKCFTFNCRSITVNDVERLLRLWMNFPSTPQLFISLYNSWMYTILQTFYHRPEVNQLRPGSNLRPWTELVNMSYNNNTNQVIFQ